MVGEPGPGPVCVVCEMMVTGRQEEKASSKGSLTLNIEGYTSGDRSRGHGKLSPC